MSTSTPSSSKMRSRDNTPKAGSSSSSRQPKKYTPAMQDAQARNKEPLRDPLGDSSDEEMADPRYDQFGMERFEFIEKRRQAVIILDNPELLMMQSLVRGDSIQGTRHYYTKIACGYDPEFDTPTNMRDHGSAKGKSSWPR
ncbi:hypothetical protein F5884DRAFT_782942 [Xylogone sp. PMI_703]|nr:hypothetical protein F5884DRAFT_782942 [Xylogone sp. PMI_703]